MADKKHQKSFESKFTFPLLTPQIHLPQRLFDPLDIQRVMHCQESKEIRTLLNEFENEFQPKSAVFVTLNDEHAMVFILPFDCFKKIHLKDGKSPEIGRDYGQDADNIGEEWYTYRFSDHVDNQLMLIYHITIDEKEYIVERYQMGKKRQLMDDDRQYSVGRMWNNVAGRKFYFMSIRFNQRQLDLLVIWLIKRNDHFTLTKKGYSLIQNDCLEFAKDFILTMAKFGQCPYQKEIVSNISSLTIMKGSLLVSSEFSSRNVTVAGLSIGVSYKSAINTSNVYQNIQQHGPAEASCSHVPWMVLSSIATAAAVVIYLKLYK